jgi:hypothetical protein
MPDWNKPDWRKIIRERLSAPNSPCTLKEEVIAELAAHLEETYEDARSRNLDEPGAMKIAMQEVTDWRVLSAEIRRAKSKETPMNDRTKTIWLPAIANLTGAALFLMILQKSGFQPRILWTKDMGLGPMAMVIYLPWLCALPVFGAIAAYLAQRAHSRSTGRVISALAPALAMLGSFSLILPFSIAIDRHMVPLGYFAFTLFNWVVLPGCASLIGAAPFLRKERNPQPA